MIMNNNFCPNRSGCQIITIVGFVQDPLKKVFYISNYCEAGELSWKSCKRYQIKEILNMCPDFILPDSTYTIDEILDKLEE
jgi:hypothetical protein